MTTVRATYRLQLNKDFTFADAAALVPYLEDLGVSHAYLSPILKAQPGSTHGYDTVDHTLINPELGTLDDFRALSAALKARSMGIILDFVPNHMGVGGAHNTLWLDVLRHGPFSRYADWFDIDWHPPRPGMDGKLLVPFLGKSYAEVLADGDLSLRADEDGLAVWAYDSEKLPIRSEDASALLEQHGSIDAVIAAHAAPEALDRLISRQHWRPAHFATAADEINYRRFFINSELAGIRIDRPEVFDHAHRLIFSLIEEGLVDGLRIDHIDGLLDPLAYLRTLRSKSPRPIYLAIEKILAPHEYLRPEWPIEGTTGYEVGAELTRLLTQPKGEAAVTAAYENFIGSPVAPAEESYRSKLRVMDNELAVELGNLARQGSELAWSTAATRDITQQALRRALRELIAHLEVYRTYFDKEGLDSRDSRELSLAFARARQTAPQVQPAVFDFLEEVILGDDANAAFVGKLQQYTGPVMAKGLEDTALYRYNRLVSLNEVGAHPDRFSLSVSAFHDSNLRRLQNHPHCLLATSTHDTKRGEDTRMMIAAIADAPEDWGRALSEWVDILGEDAGKVHRNDLYLLFQLLLGGWPVDGSMDDFAERLKGAMTKSLREARERSDWGVNNAPYEEAIADLIDTLLAHETFLASFRAVRERYAEIGLQKALIQTVLKLTIPGVPDIYRGAEDWEQSFVDPDNRRPLDFAALARRLASPSDQGDKKLILTQTLLQFRRQHPTLFSEGDYHAIDAGEEVLVFQRRLGGTTLTVRADLSAGHGAGFEAFMPSGQTIAGDQTGPFWVTLTEH